MIYPVWSSKFTIQETWKIFKAAPKLSLIFSLSVIALSTALFPPFHAALFLLIIWGSILDIRTHLVPDIILITIGALLMMSESISIQKLVISAILVTTLVLTKYWLQKKKKGNHFGWGDIKFLTVSLPFLSLESLSIFFVTSGIMAIAIHLVLRKKEIPLFPILGGSFFMLFMQF